VTERRSGICDHSAAPHAPGELCKNWRALPSGPPSKSAGAAREGAGGALECRLAEAVAQRDRLQDALVEEQGETCRLGYELKKAASALSVARAEAAGWRERALRAEAARG
jgi:hypothetical protein